MKKPFVVFMLCFVLVLGGAAAGGLALHNSREQVEVTAATLKGDPAAAEGLVAEQWAYFRDRLFWAISVPAARPEEADTDFSLRNGRKDLPAPDNADYGGVELSVVSGIQAGFSGGSLRLDDITEDDRTLASLAPVFSDVLSRAPYGNPYTEVIDPRDYMSTYPLSLEADLPLEDSHYLRPHLLSGAEALRYEAVLDTFEQFFSFPIPEGERWTVTVQHNETDGISRLDCLPADGGYLSSVSAVGANTCYFALTRGHGDKLPDLSQVPGGFGLYAIDYDTALDKNSLRTVYQLDPAVYVLHLALSPDEETLALVTWEEDAGYTCTLLDPATFSVKQSIPLPIEGLTVTDYGTFWETRELLWQEDAFLCYSDAIFCLYTLNDDAYTLTLCGQTPDILKEYYGRTVWAWNGERLAIGAPGIDNVYELGFRLLVYGGEGELLYEGDYSHSLREIHGSSDIPGASPQLLDANALTLVWK